MVTVYFFGPLLLCLKFPIAALIVPFAITINSNVCPHILVLNTLMRESYA